MATRGDAPDATYQAFPVCTGGQVPTADGCVLSETLDADGNPTTETPEVVRFSGVTGHFSTWGVAIVEPRPEPVFRPDALISTRRAGGYVGNGIYNTTGTGQSKAVKARRTTTKTFYVKVQNDGDTSETLRLKGCRTGSGFTVKYLAGVSGTSNITTAVVNGSYSLANLGPSASRSIRMKVTVSRKARIGVTKTCALVVSSAGSTNKDVVKGKVKAIKR